MLEKLAQYSILRWIFSGGVAFIIDFSLLFVLVEFFGVYHVAAASFAFLISASTNYLISRLFIFNATTSGLQESYLKFMSISLIGLGAIALLMFVLVDIFGIHYLISRILIAGTIGVSSFYIHKYFSFKFKSGENIRA